MRTSIREREWNDDIRSRLTKTRGDHCQCPSRVNDVVEDEDRSTSPTKLGVQYESINFPQLPGLHIIPRLIRRSRVPSRRR
ncbi:MAG TPA: hypothetical protein VGS96_18945 [Thermoanaerobaculia bacterium]|nr:hypothetical protein [Thermoanaerobaculia bacterium]